jgi:hypothetical protein
VIKISGEVIPPPIACTPTHLPTHTHTHCGQTEADQERQAALNRDVRREFKNKKPPWGEPPATVINSPTPMIIVDNQRPQALPFRLLVTGPPNVSIGHKPEPYVLASRAISSGEQLQEINGVCRYSAAEGVYRLSPDDVANWTRFMQCKKEGNVGVTVHCQRVPGLGMVLRYVASARADIKPGAELTVTCLQAGVGTHRLNKRKQAGAQGPPPTGTSCMCQLLDAVTKAAVADLSLGAQSQRAPTGPNWLQTGLRYTPGVEPHALPIATSAPLVAIRMDEASDHAPMTEVRLLQSGQYGVLTTAPIAQGAWLFEFAGKRTQAACAGEGHEENSWRLPGQGCISAERCGNEARFIQRTNLGGAAANVESVPVREADGWHIVFRTMRKLEAGEQLLLDRQPQQQQQQSVGNQAEHKRQRRDAPVFAPHVATKEYIDSDGRQRLLHGSREPTTAPRSRWPRAAKEVQAWPGIRQLVNGNMGFGNETSWTIATSRDPFNHRIDFEIKKKLLGAVLGEKLSRQIKDAIQDLEQQVGAPALWGEATARNFSVHIMVVGPGAPAQPTHADGCRATIIIPLQEDRPRTGHTEFLQPSKKSDKKYTTFDLQLGQALCFCGKVMHRGGANTHETYLRIFLYVELGKRNSSQDALDLQDWLPK